MTRKDFQKLSRVRLVEARILLDQGCYSGAYYLAGYAVECALKACIARETRRHDFPPRDAREFYVHHLPKLLEFAKLHKAILEEAVEIRLNWDFVKQWNEGSRYEIKSDSDALALLRAIEDRRYGVLTWIRKYW